MPYLNLDPNYFDHPKTRRLVALLGKGAEILPIKLWAYCARHHPDDGSLKGYSTAEVEGIIEWEGTRGIALNALKRVGFLCGRETRLMTKDWLQHEGHLAAFSRRGKAAANARWNKDATGMPQASDKHSPSNAPPNRSTRSKPTTQQTQKTTQSGGGSSLSETPVEAVMKAYKHAKDIPMNDKTWDEANFKHYEKYAENLLSSFGGNIDACARYIFERTEDLNEKELNWNLKTIARHATEGIGRKDRENEDEREPSSVDAGGVSGRRRNGHVTRAGEIVGDALNSLREQAAVSSREKSDVDAPRSDCERDAESES